MTTRASIRERLDAQALHERRRAGRTLLVTPLVLAAHRPEEHRLIRRHAEGLREWFSREVGWTLTVDSTMARLQKVPGDLDDPTRPARARTSDPPFTRRRYVLLCLALAHLETVERQTTLQHLAEAVLASVAADPALGEAGIRFQLEGRDERRDLVGVARFLLGAGVLRRMDGDETAYVEGTGDALYTVERAVLSRLLTARRPPSTVEEEDFDGRLAALASEPAPDTRDARNRALRLRLTRRLLDDPVVYYDDLPEDELAYLRSQRHRITSAIENATGLVAEVRAEGIAMVDPRAEVTDVKMPDQGTDGHLTLLVAEHLSRRLRDSGHAAVSRGELEREVARLVEEHASHWRRAVREPGAEARLAEEAVERLVALGLARHAPDGVVPLPAIARYAVEEPTVQGEGARPSNGEHPSLFPGEPGAGERA